MGYKDMHLILVMELLGPNMKKLFEFCDKKFTTPTLSWIGLQMLDRIEVIHSMNYIHRDIKPDNFLVGGNE